MDSFSTLVKTIFFAGKVFGFFPFSLDSEKNLKKSNFCDILQISVNVIFWCVIFYYRFLTGLTVQKSASSLAEIGVSFGALMGFFVLIGSCLGNYMNRLKFFHILENLKSFDQRVCLRPLINYSDGSKFTSRLSISTCQSTTINTFNSLSEAFWV